MAAIHPGALDLFENGIDEDCDGRDAVNRDRDGDGFPVPADCNDADAAIRPGALEIRGNDVDENCDRKAERFGLLRSLVLSNWQFGEHYSRVRSMDIRNAPKGAQVSLSCKGCALKGTKRLTVDRDLAAAASEAVPRRGQAQAGRLDHRAGGRERARRAHLHLQGRPLRRVPGAVDRVPGAGREGGALMLKRALILALAVSALAPGAAHATGVFQVAGPTVIYTAAPGDIDQIAAFETPTTIRFTRFGGASFGPGPKCTFLLNDPNTIDCVKTGVTSVVLDLGDGDDVASIDPSLKLPVIFNGADGRDGLFGGGGSDIFDGGAGDDNIISRDGRGEQVTCGAGRDTAISDDADTRDSCEEVQGDADLDGVRHPADCDDTNPGIHPGAVDVADNGVDEDCSGVDAVDLDRDADGTPRPQDCDDTVAAVHPGATEVIGNTRRRELRRAHRALPAAHRLHPGDVEEGRQAHAQRDPGGQALPGERADQGRLHRQPRAARRRRPPTSAPDVGQRSTCTRSSAGGRSRRRPGSRSR